MIRLEELDNDVIASGIRYFRSRFPGGSIDVNIHQLCRIVVQIGWIFLGDFIVMFMLEFNLKGVRLIDENVAEN